MSVKLMIVIYDLANYSRTGVLDEVESLILRQDWNKIQYSEMKVNTNHPATSLLHVDSLLIVNNDYRHAYIIEEVEMVLGESVYSYSLLPLKGILNWRAAYPYAGGYSWVQQPQDTVMNNLVWRHCTSDGLTSAGGGASRAFTNLLTLSAVGDGDLIDYKEDGALLGEKLEDLSDIGNSLYGWGIYPCNSVGDPTAIGFTHLSFWVKLPLPKLNIIFSTAYDNLDGAIRRISTKEYKTTAYVSDGTNIVETNPYGATSGFNKREIFIQSTGEQTSQGMMIQGAGELRSRIQIDTLEGQVTEERMEAQYQIGDIVTVEWKSDKTTENIRRWSTITEIEEVWESGEYKKYVKFGRGNKSFMKKIKGKFKEVWS